jgi:hypothetical protein
MRGGNRRAEQVEQKCAKRYLQERSLVCSVCMIRDSVQAALCHFHRSHAGDRLPLCECAASWKVRDCAPM